MGGAPFAAALFFTALVALAAAASSNGEGDILHAQRLAWQDPKKVLESWDPARYDNPCYWPHVTCGLDDRVIRLDLGDAGISGPLIPQLGGLKNLQFLELYGNDLNGSIPVTLGNLSNLINLDLEHNRLTGSIPTSLGALSQLLNLRLQGNKLTGSIPPSLGNLTNLVNLELQMNQLSGSIPASLGNIKTLQILRLSGNMLNNTVPPEIVSLATVGNLSELNITNNNLVSTAKSGGLKATSAHGIFSYGSLSFGLGLASVILF